MEIIKGKYSGFCAGVNNTYFKAKEELLKGKTYCLGEIIHNDQVSSELSNMGMITKEKIEEIPDNSRVIFRAHGEGPKSYIYVKDHNLNLIDLTCPKVKAIHDKVSNEKNDSFILIIGKKTHPEIIGTYGFSGNDCYIIENGDDILDSFEKFKKSSKNKVYVVSQTTFSSLMFDLLVNKIKEIYNCDIKIDKTICDATQKRQDETHEISKKCNIMLVIGSKNSSNTKELYNISRENCDKVFFIEKESDINNILFDKNDIIGVVAGASAPKTLIDSIISKIKT